jgi:hypothetical protein
VQDAQEELRVRDPDLAPGVRPLADAAGDRDVVVVVVQRSGHVDRPAG